MVTAGTGSGGRWLRGSFHGHCDENSACASVPLTESVDRYRAAGCRILITATHGAITMRSDGSGVQIESTLAESPILD